MDFLGTGRFCRRDQNFTEVNVGRVLVLSPGGLAVTHLLRGVDGTSQVTPVTLFDVPQTLGVTV